MSELAKVMAKGEKITRKICGCSYEITIDSICPKCGDIRGKVTNDKEKV